jgi:hypothetical protein
VKDLVVSLPPLLILNGAQRSEGPCGCFHFQSIAERLAGPGLDSETRESREARSSVFVSGHEFTRAVTAAK